MDFLQQKDIAKGVQDLWGEIPLAENNIRSPKRSEYELHRVC